MKYILDSESLIFLTKKGDIIKYSVDNSETENVGCIENGIIGTINFLTS